LIQFEHPVQGESYYTQLQAQALQIYKCALSIYPKASKDEYPSGDNDPETRKAKVLFSCMHSKDPVDVPEDKKVAFNPERDILNIYHLNYKHMRNMQTLSSVPETPHISN